MMVYRAVKRDVRPRDVLKLAVFDSHDARRRFLIHFGELEAAVADHEPSEDVQRLYREVSLAAGRLFCSGDPVQSGHIRELLRRLPLPSDSVRGSVPEGYAYY